MCIYSNDNIRKIAKLTTRELPQKSKNAEITVRENNGLYSITLYIQMCKKTQDHNYIHACTCQWCGCPFIADFIS